MSDEVEKAKAAVPGSGGDRVKEAILILNEIPS